MTSRCKEYKERLGNQHYNSNPDENLHKMQRNEACNRVDEGGIEGMLKALINVKENNNRTE